MQLISLKSFGELVMCHKGARICVMGGGPSLLGDLEVLDGKADVWISVNDHGAKVRSVDYAIAMDNLHTTKHVLMDSLIRPLTNAPIIGPWQWCDYALTDYPLNPRMLFTGVVATWAASLMGAHPVILAGFDCTGHAKRSIEQHREYAAKFVTGKVRAISGPLTEVWGRYHADDVLGDYTPPDVLDYANRTNGVLVRVRKPVDIRGGTYPVGSLLRVPKAEVWRQIKHRSLVEVDEPAPQESQPQQPPKRRRQVHGAPPSLVLNT
jgi:hypothetical protein